MLLQIRSKIPEQRKTPTIFYEIVKKRLHERFKMMVFPVVRIAISSEPAFNPSPKCIFTASNQPVQILILVNEVIQVFAAILET